MRDITRSRAFLLGKPTGAWFFDDAFFIEKFSGVRTSFGKPTHRELPAAGQNENEKSIVKAPEYK